MATYPTYSATPTSTFSGQPTEEEIYQAAVQEAVRRASRGGGSAEIPTLLPQVQQQVQQSAATNMAPINASNASLDDEIAQLEAQIAEMEAARYMNSDPRQDLMTGIGGQLGFTSQGFSQAQDVLNPLAGQAQNYSSEIFNLMGLGGDQAYQSALGRVSDPLRAEQERALMRNNAALGGVGGNILSALAEQTRARTEANIGNRLAQLSSAGAPSLNALQQISNLRLNQGLSLSDIMGGAGRDLASQETARRQALANVELGQGSELAQLSQNLGTARAGGAAFAAQNPNPLTQGILGGLSAYTGAGGTFGGRLGGNYAGIQNPNTYGNYA